MNAARAPRVEPTHAHLQRAFNVLHRPHWPATLEAALQDRFYERLLHGLAVNYARAEVRPCGKPPAPLRTGRPMAQPGLRHAAARPPAFDPKRAAANDLDEQDPA